MCKSRVWTPQDLRFVRELKESLWIPHLGISAMPRKEVAAAIDRSEGWYSRVLNFDETDWIPDAVDLRKITNKTGNREPLRVFNRWMGEDLGPQERVNPFELLAQALDADGTFESEFSRDLADGELSREEAQRLLPKAAARLQQAQKAVDALRERAEGRK